MANRPLTAQERKERPVYSGVICYFPDALLEVAHVSFLGNQQHNPGEPLHWAKEKSTDEPDCILRHLIDHAKGIEKDVEGVRHLAKVAWRALANLQRAIDQENQIPTPPVGMKNDRCGYCGGFFLTSKDDHSGCCNDCFLTGKDHTS